jgi:hypothetical protein
MADHSPHTQYTVWRCSTDRVRWPNEDPALDCRRPAVHHTLLQLQHLQQSVPVEQTDSVDSHEVEVQLVVSTCYQEVVEASEQKMLAAERMAVVQIVGFLGHRCLRKARIHY